MPRTRQKQRQSHTAEPPQAQAACSTCLQCQLRCTQQQQQTQQLLLWEGATGQLLLLLPPRLLLLCWQ
jgi:hypothetical protein